MGRPFRFREALLRKARFWKALSGRRYAGDFRAAVHCPRIAMTTPMIMPTIIALITIMA